MPSGRVACSAESGCGPAAACPAQPQPSALHPQPPGTALASPPPARASQGPALGHFCHRSLARYQLFMLADLSTSFPFCAASCPQVCEHTPARAG